MYKYDTEIPVSSKSGSFIWLAERLMMAKNTCLFLIRLLLCHAKRRSWPTQTKMLITPKHVCDFSELQFSKLFQLYFSLMKCDGKTDFA